MTYCKVTLQGWERIRFFVYKHKTVSAIEETRKQQQKANRNVGLGLLCRRSKYSYAACNKQPEEP